MGFCFRDFPMGILQMSWHGPAYTPQIFQGMSFFNKKIKSAVGESLYNFYRIQGDRGEKKGIKLDREMVAGLSD